MFRSVYASYSTHSHAIIINIYNTKCSSSFSAADRGTILSRARVIKKIRKNADTLSEYIGKYTTLSFTLEINNASTGERKH